MDLKSLDTILKIISNRDIKSYKDFISLLKEKKEEFKKECFLNLLKKSCYGTYFVHSTSSFPTTATKQW